MGYFVDNFFLFSFIYLFTDEFLQLATQLREFIAQFVEFLLSLVHAIDLIVQIVLNLI